MTDKLHRRQGNPFRSLQLLCDDPQGEFVRIAIAPPYQHEAEVGKNGTPLLEANTIFSNSFREVALIVVVAVFLTALCRRVCFQYFL